MNWTFTYIPPEDETVDPEWKLDQNLRLSIQDARSYGGGLVVTEESPEDDVEDWITHHRTCDDLVTAKRAVIELAERWGSPPVLSDGGLSQSK